MSQLAKHIRHVQDFPKPGIGFKDITTLLKDAEAFKKSVAIFADHFRNKNIHKVVGIESRGFIFGAPVALELQAGFVPARKPNKLPADAVREEYQLEYGTDALEMHRDAIAPNENVAVIDDLLATGGTAAATARLIEQLGGKIAGFAFLIELDFLHGRKKLSQYDILTLIHVESE